MIHSNILSALGHTPIVTINRLCPNANVKLLAKVESCNPGGSIKDRVALAMVEAAEASGELTPEKTVIEATSGNTGIGIAMVCAVKGYRCMLLMSESASEERRRIMRAYGAEIRLTPGHMGTDGAIEEAYRLAREESDKYVLLDQYNNPACIKAHYHGTAQEIWDQTDGKVTHVIATLGTTGTAMGIAKRMHELSPDVRVIAVEPYTGHKIQGLKNMQESYPPGIYDKFSLAAVVRVEDEEAFETTRRLAREEGLFTGMSSGAAMSAALRVASEIEKGVIVVILPDGGERYLSTALFASEDKRGPSLATLSSGSPARIAPDAVPGGRSGLFAVGPALDAPGDAEAWRRICLNDVLGRYLRTTAAHPDDVNVAVGLADLDDRALAAAREAGVSRAAFARSVVERLRRFADILGIDQRTVFALSSDSTDTGIAAVRRLLGRGQAYEKLRSVYFDVLRADGYGSMTGSDPGKLLLGKTVDLADYVKENAQDFTLLKRASLQDLKLGDCLQTEWGNIRPSWFLQVAAVAADALGDITVFHAGEAHRFPHIENFRAILAHALGKSVPAWTVCQPVSAAESECAPGLDALLAACGERGEAHRALRLWLLSVSRHKALVYSAESLAMWQRNQSRAQNLAADLAAVSAPAAEARGGRRKAAAALSPDVEQALVGLRTGLRDAVEDDLALHHFWPALFGFCRDVRRRLDGGNLSGEEARECLNRFRAADDIIGFLHRPSLPLPRHEWPVEAVEIVERRSAARAARDFDSADAIRRELEALGFAVEDGVKGVRLYSK